MRLFYWNTVLAVNASGNMPEMTEKELKQAAKWLENLKTDIIMFGIQLVIALVVFLVGKKIVKWLKKVFRRSFERSNMDQGVQKFLISLINIALNVLLFVVVITTLGVEASSLAAVIGSAGLTVGLALQGSLSNFAGGVLILIMKPFQIGDYIVVDGLEGTVTGIDIFYTRLLTVDNRKVVIPNGGLANSNIVNNTNEELRSLNMRIPVAYDTDIPKAKQILYRLAENEERVVKDRPIKVFVAEFKDSAIELEIRMWTQTEKYWDLKWDMLEEVKRQFDENDIAIPFNQLDVNVSVSKEIS